MRKIVFLWCFVFGVFSFFAQENNTIEAPSFSLNSGFYKTPIRLVIKESNKEDKIFYTTDGSTPSSKSYRYKDTLTIDKTTVLKAVTYLEGKKSTATTATYFINAQHDLPVVSLSTNPKHLWDSVDGIYVEGCCADSLPPHKGANYWKSTEVPTTFEYFTEEKERVVNQVVDMRIFGGFTRSLPQKSLALIARDKYGNNRMEYPFFKTQPKQKKYKALVLRNSGGDFNKSNFRDGLLTHLAAETGLITQAYQATVLYINGEYWGIQNLREKINEHFLEDHFGVDDDSVDIIKHRMDVQEGSIKEYKTFWKYLEDNTFSTNEKIRELNQKMDIDNYLTYHISQVYFDNMDASGNIRAWRKQGDNNRWSWLLFDLDLSYSISGTKGYKNNTLELFTTHSDTIWPNPWWCTYLIRKLLQNDSIKQLYITKTLDYLNTSYSTDNIIPKIDSVAALIESEIPRHSQRWRRNPKYWYRTVDIMRNFAKYRPHYLRQHLLERFELNNSDTCTITVYNNSQKGKAKFNHINKIDSFSGIYFTNIVYQISVTPSYDFWFLGWKNNRLHREAESIIPTQHIVLEALYEEKPKSKNSKNLIFNELKLKSSSGNDWIEFYNRSEKTISLHNWLLVAKKGEFLLPDIRIEPKSYVVIDQGENFSFNISAKKDSIKLYDADTLLVAAFSLNNKGVELDELTYALKSPLHNEQDKTSWLINYKSSTKGEQNVFYTEMITFDKNHQFWLKVVSAIMLLIGFATLGFALKKRPSESAVKLKNTKKPTEDTSK